MSFEIPPDIGRRTAPELYGMFFNYGLMGSLLVQVYHYYGSFPKDRTITKVIVYGLFVLELVQTGIMSYFAYTIFGSGYGNLEVFDKSALEWFPVCILGSLIAGIVQLFYAYRLHVFSGSKSRLALLQISSGIAQGVISKLTIDRSNLTERPICVTIWLLSSALCDIVIAGSMSYYLRRSQLISPRLKDAITRMVRYTVETGAITAVVAVVQVVVQLAFPKNNFFETPSWTLGKLYSNNLLVLLNARAVVLGGRSHIASSERPYPNEINLDSRGGIAPGRTDDSLGSSIRFHHGDVTEVHVRATKEEGNKYGSSGTGTLERDAEV
ncbi:hypothetical protein FB451DRAFT_1119217 [Mycena latifolia]|nr:hypothetical protein FB451DRAFT_1119217 [Mycena latifolia]